MEELQGKTLKCEENTSPVFACGQESSRGEEDKQSFSNKLSIHN